MTTIALPSILDRQAAQSLAPEISDAITQGSKVELDAAKVAKIGQVGIQLLISAAITATHRGAAIAITNASECLLAAVKMTNAGEQIGLGNLKS
jgi:ABC-type transporter Mla MlaB component